MICWMPSIISKDILKVSEVQLEVINMDQKLEKENMKEVDDLRDEVRSLDKSIKSLWRHQVILACILCFTEFCDLIKALF